MNNNEKENVNQNKNKKKATSKQVVAIVGVVLLVLMYLVTLVVAFVDTSASGHLFAMCLFASFAIPFLIWIYAWLYQKMVHRNEDALENIKDDSEE